MDADQVEVGCGYITGLGRRQVDALLGTLERSERERAARIALEAPRRLYILARAIARVELARILGCRSESVRFAATSHGKPYVAAPTPAPQISLSHGGTMAACVIAWENAVGIDIELKDRAAFDPDVLRAHLSADELGRLSGLGENQLTEALAAIWTAKEAVAKAYGAGLSIALDRFSVPAADGVVPDVDGIGTWRVRRLFLDRAHRVAVALGGDPLRPVEIHQRVWPPEALLAAIRAAELLPAGPV